MNIEQESPRILSKPTLTVSEDDENNGIIRRMSKEIAVRKRIMNRRKGGSRRVMKELGELEKDGEK